ncbi:hypothetical protein K0U83_26315 [bacterium]|nr:hypothetical protein [bacterium]
MPVGTTAAIVAVSAVVLTAGGFIAGRQTAPDQVVPLVEAQTAQIDTLADGMADLVSRSTAPITLDAETRAALARTPPQCVRVLGGDPLSMACAWSSCLMFTQSNGQRPECRAIEAAYLASIACPEELPESGSE